jgi:hypothetical protein
VSFTPSLYIPTLYPHRIPSLNWGSTVMGIPKFLKHCSDAHHSVESCPQNSLVGKSINFTWSLLPRPQSQPIYATTRHRSSALFNYSFASKSSSENLSRYLVHHVISLNERRHFSGRN